MLSLCQKLNHLFLTSFTNVDCSFSFTLNLETHVDVVSIRSLGLEMREIHVLMLHVNLRAHYEHLKERVVEPRAH